MPPDEKSETLDGVSYRYGSEWIHSLETEDHWRLYWRQQKIMENRVLPGQEVLEIGAGSGFTANYLRSKGVSVVTLDIDTDKGPDIHTNIVTFDFPDAYDHILAFEVFEHIPYDRFLILLDKIARACRGYLFVAVPRNERIFFRFILKLHKIIRISVELFVKKRKITEQNHHWEVDHGETSAGRLEEDFRLAGFTVMQKEKAFGDIFYVLQSPLKS
jgi:2-polyprenyl-3-methyl-5-hydroxy-6-metoxy-1,4-benzoquinol methylase